MNDSKDNPRCHRVWCDNDAEDMVRFPDGVEMQACGEHSAWAVNDLDAEVIGRAE